MTHCPKCESTLSENTRCEFCGWTRRINTKTSKPARDQKKGESYASRNRRERREDAKREADAAIEGEVADLEVWREGGGFSGPRRAIITMADGRQFELDHKFEGFSKHAIEEAAEEPTRLRWNEITD